MKKNLPIVLILSDKKRFFQLSFLYFNFSVPPSFPLVCFPLFLHRFILQAKVLSFILCRPCFLFLLILLTSAPCCLTQELEEGPQSPVPWNSLWIHGLEQNPHHQESRRGQGTGGLWKIRPPHPPTRGSLLDRVQPVLFFLFSFVICVICTISLRG